MKNLLLIALAFALASCKDVKKSEYRSAESTVEMKAVVAGASHPGKKLIERECYICHDPKASQESMFAPPMVAVKTYYINEKTTKAQFTENLIKWVNDPETESKMPGALFEFGSMPYIPYPDDAIAQIAEYMYEYDIERPEWYDDALAEGNGKGILMNRNIIAKEIQQKNADRGMAHANAAKTTLGKNLLKALGEKGTIGAIEFCNTRALPLTDSISVMNNVVIKRVSDKPRNPENKANNEELDYITYFKKLAIAGKEAKPIVKRENDEVHFYYPITTNAMCLQCHGKPVEQVTPETLSTLKNLYPKDQAVGYDTNEVRGIWVVNFDSEK
ncbi:MAG: DUF3365 domain-containing protein [Flavobacteriaceae bacterium]